MSTRNLVAAIAMGFAALAGGFGAAEAHGMGNSMHMSGMNGGMNKGMNSGMPHHDYFRHRELFIVGTSHPDCGHLYDEWQLTGSLYWKSKFLECKYGS